MTVETMIDARRTLLRAAGLVTVVSLLAFPGISTSQDLGQDTDFNKGGRTALQFLKIGIGARQAALGEASIASVREANAALWNPANISGVSNYEASFSYVRWLADMAYVSGTIGKRWDHIGVVAVSIASLDYGSIEESLVSSSTGSNDTRTGNTFSGSDLLVGVAFARDFTDRLSIGLGAKFIREDLFRYSVNTIAFDVGTNYDVGYGGVRLAMSAQNFGGSVKWLGESSQQEGFDIPLVFRIGISANVFSGTQNAFANIGSPHQLAISAEAINTNDFSERFHFGAEYLFYDFLAFRGGYRFNYAEGNVSLGFGLNTRLSGLGVRLDYAYVDYEFLEAPHRLTMAVTF